MLAHAKNVYDEAAKSGSTETCVGTATPSDLMVAADTLRVFQRPRRHGAPRPQPRYSNGLFVFTLRHAAGADPMPLPARAAQPLPSHCRRPTFGYRANAVQPGARPMRLDAGAPGGRADVRGRSERWKTVLVVAPILAASARSAPSSCRSAPLMPSATIRFVAEQPIQHIPFPSDEGDSHSSIVIRFDEAFQIEARDTISAQSSIRSFTRSTLAIFSLSRPSTT